MEPVINIKGFLIKKCNNEQAASVVADWNDHFTQEVYTFINSIENREEQKLCLWSLVDLKPSNIDFIYLDQHFLNMHWSPFLFDFTQIEDPEIAILPVWNFYQKNKEADSKEIVRANLMIIGILSNLKKDYDFIEKMWTRRDHGTQRYAKAQFKAASRAMDLLSKWDMTHVVHAPFDYGMTPQHFLNSMGGITTPSPALEASTGFLLL